jgi:hypothetical protein
MALLEEQFTETLNAGAPDITYEGSEGREQQIAQALWDRLPPQARMQFGSFQQFFSSGAWKKVLQMLQQQMQGQEGPQERIQETETIQTQPQPQQGIASMMPAQMAYGGIAGPDGRRAYGIGSWFQKKIMDPIKKNPLITAAVLAGGSTLMGPYKGWIGEALKGIKGKGITSTLGNILGDPKWTIPAASLVAGAFAKPEEALQGGAMSRGAGINLQDIAKLANITDEQQGQAIGLNFLPEASARKYSPEEMALTYSQAAHGGRIGYAGGGILNMLRRLMTPEGKRFKKFEFSGGNLSSDKDMLLNDILEEMSDEIYGKPYGNLNKKQQMKISDAANEELFNIQAAEGDAALDRFKEGWAQGGRIGYAGGGGSSEYEEWATSKGLDSAAKSTFQKWNEMIRLELDLERLFNKAPLLKGAQGGRIGAQEGGLMNLGGMEKDYRNDGGFVPIGGEEKADDVPARLSRNEFVFTADAVRNAGGGDIDAGAEVMENVMKNLEGLGTISDESQGKGAREMFEVSERLSEVV